MKPKINEKQYLFLMAKVRGMSVPEKLHRLAQLTEYEEWIKLAKMWLNEEALSSENNNLCS